MIVDDLIPLATPLDSLKPWSKNPRKGDVGAIAKSLAKFGQRRPIVARRSTNEVIAGNHTLAAAKQLGWKQIAVVWVEDDDQTATAFALADNRTQDLGYYDEEMLEELIGSLTEQDLIFASGYGDGEMEIPSPDQGVGVGGFSVPDPNAITTQYTDSVDGTIAQRTAPNLDPNMAMIVKIGGIELRLERQEAEPLVNCYRRYVEKKGTATGFFLWLIEGRGTPE
jgi:hypothetical protein